MNYITNTYPSRSVFLPAFRWDSSWSFRAFLWRPKGMFVFPINSIPSGVSVYPSPLQNRVQQGSNGSIRKQPYHPHPLPLSPFTHPLSPETEYFSSVLLKVEPPHFPNVVILCCLSCSSSSFPHQRLRPLCPKHLSGILYTMYAMTLGWEWDQRRTTMDDTSSCPNWILLRILQHCDAMIITRTVDAFTIPTGRHQCQSKRMDMKGIKSGGQRTHQLNTLEYSCGARWIRTRYSSAAMTVRLSVLSESFVLVIRRNAFFSLSAEIKPCHVIPSHLLSAVFTYLLLHLIPLLN